MSLVQEIRAKGIERNWIRALYRPAGLLPTRPAQRRSGHQQRPGQPHVRTVGGGTHPDRRLGIGAAGHGVVVGVVGIANRLDFPAEKRTWLAAS